jgi:hypothetical protein
VRANTGIERSAMPYLRDARCLHRKYSAPPVAEKPSPVDGGGSGRPSAPQPRNPETT